MPPACGNPRCNLGQDMKKRAEANRAFLTLLTDFGGKEFRRLPEELA